jgi:hypothetical protein
MIPSQSTMDQSDRVSTIMKGEFDILEEMDAFLKWNFNKITDEVNLKPYNL